VLPWIEEVPDRDLNVEQLARLKAIRRQLRVTAVDDTGASLARLLVNDRQYWALVLPQVQSEQLASIRPHLTAIGVTTMAASSPEAVIASGRK
jgi:hypothetical protein